MVRERFYKSDQPKTKHQIKYARSKAKLRDAIAATQNSNVEFKKRNAELHNELVKLRGLASAVRQYLAEDEDLSFLINAAEHASVFETGPGMSIVRREKRSEAHKPAYKLTQSKTERIMSKDPSTERYYQEDQKILAQDGWQPFSVTDDKWEIG